MSVHTRPYRPLSLGTFGLAIVLLAGIFPGSELLGHEHATGIVKERMTQMEAAGRALKTINNRIKTGGSLPSVADHARQIGEMAAKIPKLFPVGSNDKPTEAKPAIWEHWPDFEARARQLVNESEKLRVAAELGDRKVVASTLRQVARTCSSCHRKYVMTR